jgi:hypothetical protein
MSFGKAIIFRGDAEHIPLADKSCSLTFTSPPYVDARLYLENGRNIGISRQCESWAAWMLRVVKECCRVTTGLVLVNCAGVTRDWRYQPAPEMLLTDWFRAGGECWRPVYWHRVGIPGSGGEQWLRADVEYVLAFKDAPGRISWADNTACGHAPKWGPGGEMSYRNSSGKRINQWGPVGGPGGGGAKRASGEIGSRERPSHILSADNANYNGNNRLQRGNIKGKLCGANHRANGDYKKVHTKSNAAGENVEQIYEPPTLANPGNLIKTTVGGGMLGSALAHENEAPFPENLVEFFIKSFAEPGSRVLDPFSGSGTTAAVARRLGRVGVGIDLRQSQCELSWRRVNEGKNLQAEMFA